MVDTPEVAAYRLNYQTGDSQQKLDATRQAAVRLVASNTDLSVSEERVTRATRVHTDAMTRELAAHDPLIRAAQRWAQTQERVNRLEQEGVGTASSRALALDLARRKYQDAITMNDSATVATNRLNASIGTLIGRYATWTTLIITARRAMQTAAETNADAADSLARLDRAWTEMAEAAAPTLTFMTNRLTEILRIINLIPAAIEDANRQLRSPMTPEQFQRRDTARPIIRRTEGIPFASAQNIPDEIEVTTARESKYKDAAASQREILRLIEQEANAVFELSQERKKMWADAVKAAENAKEDFDAGLLKEVGRLADLQINAERQAADERERVNERQVRFGEMTTDLEDQLKLAQMTTEERQREYVIMVARQRLGGTMTEDEEARLRILTDQTIAAERQAETLQGISASFSSFLVDSVRTGKVTWEDLFGSMADIFSRNLQRMVEEWLSSALFTKTPGGGFDWLSAGLSAIGSLFGGGGGGSGGFGNDWFDVGHRGGRPGRLPTRFVDRSVFDDAPRAHRGLRPQLAPNERPVIALDTERILNERETRNYDAMERFSRRAAGGGGGWNGGGGTMRVELGELKVRVDPSPEFEVRVERTAQGVAQREIQVYDKASIPGRVRELTDEPRLRS